MCAQLEAVAMSAKARTAWGKHIGGPAALFDALVADPRKLIPALELCAAFRADLTLATLPGGSFARERKSWSHLSVMSMPFRFRSADAKQLCWDRDLSAALKCTLLALFGSDVLRGRGVTEKRSGGCGNRARSRSVRRRR